MNHIKVPNEQRCYFAVASDGAPVHLQRKPYTECFFIMGLAELARATGNRKYQVRILSRGEENEYVLLLQIAAEEMLQALIHWVREDDSALGGVRLSGAPPTRELGRPMMLLNVISEVCGEDTALRSQYKAHIDWSIQAILEHVSPTAITSFCN